MRRRLSVSLPRMTVRSGGFRCLGSDRAVGVRGREAAHWERAFGFRGPSTLDHPPDAVMKSMQARLIDQQGAP